nr:retrotransposon protein, putative, Ty3-gypsy subclass [Tanacetum cinerariifolium]
AHNSPFSIHPGSTKMYVDLKQHFWWNGMKQDIATFMGKCLICQQKKNDAIWVVVDRLTKSAYFFPIRKDFSISRLTLENMLRSCALEWTGNWDEYMCLVEFAYNNSWHESIKVTNEKVTVAKEKLKEARSRQKSYVDRHRRELVFNLGDRMFLKVSPCRGVRRFRIQRKLSPRFIVPFEILDRFGEVSYRFALPP